MPRYRLPKTRDLGKGYIVSVKLVSPEELAKIMDEENMPSSRRSAGGWDANTRTIYIDKTLPMSEQWDVYFHEMAHAIFDIGRMDRVGGRR